jgi:phosphate transport system substrate-binding protein
MKKLITILCAVLFSTTVYSATNNIKIVGSSTVYPFTTVVAERFGKETKFDTPIVESTGTGGGMKLFCAGIGPNTPSVTNASRAIKDKEAKLCASNGVSYIEIAIGNDGIAFVNSVSRKKINFTKKQLWAALAEHGNKPKYWNEIDPGLPNQEIKILIPPPTSGTRDAWNDLVMNKGCPAEVKAKDKKACAKMREDGAAVEAGENDTLIVNKLAADPNAYGIMGFSYLLANKDKIQAATIEGKSISLASIQDYSYPIARPLFVYFKKEHLSVVPGLKKFLKTYVSTKAMGPKGYLTDIGLVPLDKKTFAAMVTRAKNQ